MMKKILIIILLAIPALNAAWGTCTIQCYFKFREETLFDAVYYGDLAYIKNYSGNIDVTNKKGLTAPVYARQLGRTEAARLLMLKKAGVPSGKAR
jgi:hypothetical protein